VCGTRFYPSRTTLANACSCSFITQNCWVITALFAAVRFRPVPPSLGVVTNTEGFREFWNLSCISVHSSLPISVYTWNISIWSAKYFVSHHFTWRTWPGRGQNCNAFVEEMYQGVHCNICLVPEEVPHMIRRPGQVRDPPQVPWQALAHMSLSAIRKPANSSNYTVAIDCTIGQKSRCDLLCVPALPRTIIPPSMNPPCSWSTPRSVSLHKCVQFWLLVLHPLEVN